jgi:hypothetical protein
MLLTVTRTSTTHTVRTVAFSLQQWLRERATMFRYTYVAYFVYRAYTQEWCGFNSEHY